MLILFQSWGYCWDIHTQDLDTDLSNVFLFYKHYHSRPNFSTVITKSKLTLSAMAPWDLIRALRGHYSKVKTYLGKLKKFEVILSTKKISHYKKKTIRVLRSSPPWPIGLSIYKNFRVGEV